MTNSTKKIFHNTNKAAVKITRKIFGVIFNQLVFPGRSNSRFYQFVISTLSYTLSISFIISLLYYALHDITLSIFPKFNDKLVINIYRDDSAEYNQIIKIKTYNNYNIKYLISNNEEEFVKHSKTAKISIINNVSVDEFMSRNLLFINLDNAYNTNQKDFIFHNSYLEVCKDKIMPNKVNNNSIIIALNTDADYKALLNAVYMVHKICNK